jgi:cyclase
MRISTPRVEKNKQNEVCNEMNADKKLIIMPCLDMINARVVKGVNFVNIKDAGDPVECCKAYCSAGADELAMLDITVTVEGRATMLEVVRKVADAVTVPFTMGGGISSVKAAEEVLNAGADKFSTSSAVFRSPDMIGEMVKEFGQDKVTVAIDVAQNTAMPSGYEVFIDGGRTATGTDAIEWTKRVNDYGVKTILPTSKSTDGARTGYDLPLIRKIREITDANIVASGGAGTLEHFAEAAEAGANILLAASVFHFNIIPIPELKEFLKSRGFSVS